MPNVGRDSKDANYFRQSEFLLSRIGGNSNNVSQIF